jgi:hypothetical protein
MIFHNIRFILFEFQNSRAVRTEWNPSDFSSVGCHPLKFFLIRDQSQGQNVFSFFFLLPFFLLPTLYSLCLNCWSEYARAAQGINISTCFTQVYKTGVTSFLL